MSECFYCKRKYEVDRQAIEATNQANDLRNYRYDQAHARVIRAASRIVDNMLLEVSSYQGNCAEYIQRIGEKIRALTPGEVDKANGC